MGKKKQKKRKKAAKPSRPRLLLAVGDRVRVKDEVMDPDYEDLCIGGWTGKIVEIDKKSDPSLVEIEWDEKTLTELIGEEFLEKADRHGLDGARIRLGLTDVERIDLATSTRPPKPADPSAKLVEGHGVPLGEDDKRVARIFGLPEQDGPPDVTDDTLEIYYKYLKEHLRLPFEGEYSVETGFMQDTYYQIKVTGLADFEDCDEDYGLLCEGREGRRRVVVPLAEIEVDDDDPNYQLIDDYQYWFWNFR